MPLYEYKCSFCGYQIEKLSHRDSEPTISCTQCSNKTLSRMVSKPQFQLSGGGWYKDGYHATNSQTTESPQS